MIGDAGQGRSWRTALGLLWLGQIVSHLGDALFLAAIFYLARDVTGSAQGAGVIMALNFVPALVLGLLAGAVVDRSDRRRVMIVADLVRFVAVGAIPLLAHRGWLGPTALASCVFLLATGTTAFNPALKAIIAELTPAEHLTTANAVYQVSEYASLFMGPLLGAWLTPSFGVLHLFTVDSASFLFSAACLAIMPRALRAPRVAPPPAAPPLGEALRALRAGMADALREARRIPLLRALLVLTALDNFTIMGLAYVATPLLVRESLGLPVQAYAAAQSWFFAAMAVATLLYWLFLRRVRKGLVILVGIVLDGLTFIPFAFCRALGDVKLALVVHAVAIPLIIVPRTVLIQQAVPGPLHGRVFALLNMTVFGMMALSNALAGVLAERLGPAALFIIMGSLGTLPGLCGFAIPSLRRAR